MLPVIMEISSLCPFPSTPAIPTISPFLTSMLTPESLGILNLSTYVRFWAFSTTSPASTRALSYSKEISLPTIRLEISSSDTSFVRYVPLVTPPFKTVILSLMRFTSFSLWDMKIMVIPRSLSSISRSNSSSVSWGVSTAVGSSRMISLALR